MGGNIFRRQARTQLFVEIDQPIAFRRQPNPREEILAERIGDKASVESRAERRITKDVPEQTTLPAPSRIR